MVPLRRYALSPYALKIDARRSYSPRMNLYVRQAVPADVPVLTELIHASVRALQAEDYTEAQREAALRSVFGVDSQLIADGTYLVAESSIPELGLPAIAGCGGWSKRKTLYGGDAWSEREDSLLDPEREAAKIRAFFIHPAWARRGVGTLILEACERAAAAAGFNRFEMGATLTGAKLFAAKGYLPIRRIELPLPDGETLPILHMKKKIAS
jgi:GNAT superfamily N-acetyltransferase